MLVLWLLVGCGGAVENSAPDDGSSPSNEASVGAARGQIVSTASGLIGEVTDLTVSEQGWVVVADRLENAVKVFDSIGTLVHTLGRAGAGPGEFNSPIAVEARGDSVLVVDVGNARLQVVTLEGSYVRSEGLPALPRGGYWDLGAGDLKAGPTMGLDSALVKVFDGPSEVAQVGTAVGPPLRRVNPAAMKQDLINGDIPDLFLNTVRPVLGDANDVWIVEPSRAVVERFDLTSAVRLDSVPFEDPDFEQVRRDFMAENAELPGMRMAAPDFLYGGQVIEGELWVLVAQGGDRGPELVAVAGGGDVRPLPFELPVGTVMFAVDEGRGRVYAGTNQAELFRIDGGGAR